MGRQPGFFDLDERYAELSKAGDPLEKLKAVINFEAFRYRPREGAGPQRQSQGRTPAP